MEDFVAFLKKINKTVGIVGCVLTILSHFMLLLVGTGVARIEFNFVIHALIPAVISKFFVLLWVLFYALNEDYDKTSKIFARNLLLFLIANLVITFIDYEMLFFFLVQSVTSFLLLILTNMLINQRRFAIRSKKYAAMMRVINMILAMCVGAFVVLIVTSFTSEYIFLFVGTIISQIFMIVAIISVDIVERKFQEALLVGNNDSEEEEYSD